MTASLQALVASLIALTLLLTPSVEHGAVEQGEPPSEVVTKEEVTEHVREYLESKDSPLAEDVEHVLNLKHWKLLIAISAIESQYCKRQLSFNCWGIGGDSAYRHYNSFSEAATDADALITRWQERGRWLTVEDMNCHYVVPCNPNWVRVVNLVLSELDALTGTTTNAIAEDTE